jgi:hypothetical protein
MYRLPATLAKCQTAILLPNDSPILNLALFSLLENICPHGKMELLFARYLVLMKIS